MTQLWSAVLAVQAALQGINPGHGCVNTVDPASVVVDPQVDPVTVAVGDMPYLVLCGGQATFGVQRSLEVLTQTRLKDVVTIPLLFVLAAPGDSTDVTRRFAAWADLVGDIERVLALAAAKGSGSALDSQAVYAVPTRLGAPGLGLANQSLVVGELTIEVMLTLRPYGTP